jgi:hypothetical protein
MKKNIKPAIAIAAAPPTPTPTPIGRALLLLFSEVGVSVGVAPAVCPAVSPAVFPVVSPAVAPPPVVVSFPAVVDGDVVGVVVEALLGVVVALVFVVFVLEMDVTPKSMVVMILPARADTTREEFWQSHPPRP